MNLEQMVFSLGIRLLRITISQMVNYNTRILHRINTCIPSQYKPPCMSFLVCMCFFFKFSSLSCELLIRLRVSKLFLKKHTNSTHAWEITIRNWQTHKSNNKTDKLNLYQESMDWKMVDQPWWGRGVWSGAVYDQNQSIMSTSNNDNKQ